MRNPIRKTVEGYPYQQFIYCDCGCGFTRSLYDNWGRKKNYIFEHSNRGLIRSEETKNKLRGKNNGMWKEDITYKPLHQWIRNNLPISKLCQYCKKVPPYDAANITGIYNRDFKNWKYLCRLCHMESDGRLEKLKKIDKMKNKKKKNNLLSEFF